MSTGEKGRRKVWVSPNLPLETSWLILPSGCIQRVELRPGETSFWEAEFSSRLGSSCNQSCPAMEQASTSHMCKQEPGCVGAARWGWWCPYVKYSRNSWMGWGERWTWLPAHAPPPTLLIFPVLALMTQAREGAGPPLSSGLPGEPQFYHTLSFQRIRKKWDNWIIALLTVKVWRVS